MENFPLPSTYEAKFLNSVLPIVIVLFAAAATLFLFETNKTQEEDMATAVVNILLVSFRVFQSYFVGFCLRVATGFQ